jgi:hypothetical protein
VLFVFPSYKFFDSLKEFKCLQTLPTSQNWVHEELQGNLNSGKCLILFGLELFDFVIIRI